MAHRLSPAEIAAAKLDPRLRPRPPKDLSEFQTVTEILVAEVLDYLDIAYCYADTFFPTQWEVRVVSGVRREVELGFCPDFRLPATNQRPEQFLEVTMVRSLSDKHRKIDNATSVHGITVVLLHRYCLAEIRRDPQALLNYLVEYPVAKSCVAALPNY
jgi:hypothetical protein